MGAINKEEKKQVALAEFKKMLRSITKETSIEGLINRLKEVNLDITDKGIVFNKEIKKHLLTGYDYCQFYDWDLYFENIYAIYNGESKFCFSNLEAFISQQQDDGFIKRSFGPYNYGENHPFKPFIAQTILLGSIYTNDFTFAEKNIGKIEKYLACYYERYDSDNNELCCWVNADASGMDNQVSRVLDDGNGEGVDLNCYLYREYKALAQISKYLGLDYKIRIFEEKAQKIKNAINDFLWDEKTGFYYDRNELTGKLNMVKGISGFVPLWAGIVSPERAVRLVNEHLLNKDEFYTNYPIATLSKDSDEYNQTGDQPPSGFCNWNGTVWIPMNYMVFHGLMNYGFNDIAKELSEKTFELVYVKNNQTREYYNADNGIGYGRNPFYGWSTLAYYMPLEYYMNYDPTNLENEQLISLGSILGLNLYNSI